jgi:hypothetical protein
MKRIIDLLVLRLAIWAKYSIKFGSYIFTFAILVIGGYFWNRYTNGRPHTLMAALLWTYMPVIVFGLWYFLYEFANEMILDGSIHIGNVAAVKDAEESNHNLFFFTGFLLCCFSLIVYIDVLRNATVVFLTLGIIGTITACVVLAISLGEEGAFSFFFADDFIGFKADKSDEETIPAT